MGNSGKLALVHLVVFQHRIVVAWRRWVEVVDKPQPTAVLGEEQFLLIFPIPRAEVSRIVVAQQRVAVEQSLCLLRVLAFLPKANCLVQDALVVIGYAEALGILVEQKSIVAGRAVEVRTGVGVVFVVSFPPAASIFFIESAMCFVCSSYFFSISM